MTDHLSPDAIAAATARAFSTELSARWQSLLADNLLSVTLIGSLAHGGFSRRYSDIDLAVVTETGLVAGQLSALRDAAMLLIPELASKVSLFWTDRSFEIGRFPPLDRIDYIDHGAPLFERERIVPTRPGLGEIRGYLCGKPFENWAQAATQFAALDTLEPRSHKPYVRTLLYPARFIYSYMTGRIGSSDAAVEWLNNRRLPGVDIELISAALACRRAAADPDALFSDRTRLPQQVAACAALVRETDAE
ncbi:MAG: nucleotidyltransferase domain-containing protein [Hyphomicrobiales bacterium]|nr:nucleotidyltransferase domain-containing protein [Hyphomicrobiales bacterium]